ncbi:helix-turn-helix domain-containing protein [Phormidesmis priestleyi]
MLNIGRIAHQDRWLRAMTGLNVQAFSQRLVPFYEASLEAEARERLKPRKRAFGGGRKARLKSMDAKLMFMLVYVKCYPTFDLMGILFDLDRSQANRWVHRLQPILENALGKKLVLPERKLESMEQ